MAISESVKNFRLNRASELDQFARVLQKLGNCNPYPINDAANQLRNFGFVPKINQSDPINYDYWGYDISGLTFYFEDVPRHTFPENPFNLSLSLAVKLIADFSDFGKLSDPYKHLEVNIFVSGTHINGEGRSIELITSFHLDRHISTPNDNEPEESHPIYHFQFGGRKLQKKFRDFGNALILDSPRIVHHPMDIVLTVDFVLSNFFAAHWKKMRKDGEYVNILKEYQESFWKPYAHSKAYNWLPYNQGLVQWPPVLIWPQLITKG
jgi:hypothetical protein